MTNNNVSISSTFTLLMTMFILTMPAANCETKAKSTIICATEELAEGEPINASSLIEKEVLLSQIPIDAITSKLTVTGRVSKYRVPKGQVLCQHDFLRPGDRVLRLEFSEHETKELDRLARREKKSKKELVTECIRSKLLRSTSTSGN